eukprot:GHUV01043892.1.p1 GENE.GHUV01043892.1~~GHUV01043892.1.p1  ORF type:complete len:176 (-),score=34.66 GHUV01043892.1:266-793(-)
MAAPPPLWQHEVASLAREQARIPAAAGQRLNAADGGEEKLSETWRHVKGVARDESNHHDLMALVRNARREDTYQFPVAGVSSVSALSGHVSIATALSISCQACPPALYLLRSDAYLSYRPARVLLLLSAVAIAAAPSVICHARTASHGAGQIPHLSDHVLLWSVSRDQESLGLSR